MLSVSVPVELRDDVVVSVREVAVVEGVPVVEVLGSVVVVVSVVP